MLKRPPRCSNFVTERSHILVRLRHGYGPSRCRDANSRNFQVHREIYPLSETERLANCRTADCRALSPRHQASIQLYARHGLTNARMDGSGAVPSTSSSDWNGDHREVNGLTKQDWQQEWYPQSGKVDISHWLLQKEGHKSAERWVGQHQRKMTSPDASCPALLRLPLGKVPGKIASAAASHTAIQLG